MVRYELLEPQDQESSGYRANGGTPPPPLPARQSFQMIGPKSCQKKEKESHYASAKQFSESSKHHGHDHYPKEGNYVSSKVVQDSMRHENYQRQLDNAHRNQQDHVSTNYVKLQKEKYEMKQENLYASQRELQKGDMHYVTHQKLSASNSLPLAQNAAYSLPKSSSNNNLGRCNEGYEHEGQKQERNSKYEVVGQDEKLLLDRNASCKYEQDVRGHEAKRGSTINYDYPEEIYERRNSKYDMDVSNKYEIECQHNINERKHGENQIESNRDSSIRYDLPHEFKVGEKVTCLKTTITERPVPHKINIEYRQTKEFAASLPPEMRIVDVNCPEVATLPSEDELSNGSGSVSPRLRRANKSHRGGNLTPSSGGSRNQSPRPKPGVRNSHRNSANLTSSTLQEDLMKLINPDYIGDDDQIITNNNVTGNALITNQNPNKMNNNNNNMLEIQSRCRSRENLCGGNGNALTVLPANGQENGNTGSEVILTMARPATVISNASTASSPAPSENKLSKEER